MNKPEFFRIEPNDAGQYEVQKAKKKKKGYKVIAVFPSFNEAVQWFIENKIMEDES
jgi:hypothetical protein